MFSQAMYILDRVAVTFVVILAGAPILAIAASIGYDGKACLDPHEHGLCFLTCRPSKMHSVEPGVQKHRRHLKKVSSAGSQMYWLN